MPLRKAFRFEFLVIAPVIADILGPVMTPAFRLLGADPAVFAGMFMGTDMGAAPLAQALALDPRSAGAMLRGGLRPTSLSSTH